MTANVNLPSSVPDPTLGSTPAAAQSQPVASAPGQPSAPNPADLRLVIEDDQKAGCFVYKTIDWRTGEVVQQLPREQLVKLRESDSYSAGTVVSRSV
jgi:flagellar protein FlaG